MDLYEALKGGTSEDELQKSFDEELAKARMRIAAEKKREEEEKSLKAAKEKQINDCRRLLAESVIDYANSLCDDTVPSHLLEEVEKELINFEKSIGWIYTLDKLFDNDKKSSLKTTENKNKTYSKSYSSDDDIIIQSFLDSLIN